MGVIESRTDEDEIVQFNAKRIYVMAKIVIFISVILGIINWIGSMTQVREEPSFKGYLVVYGLLILLNILCVYYFYRFSLSPLTARMYRIIVNVYIYSTILCSAVITYIDMILHGHYLIFLVIYFLCSTLFVMRASYFIGGSIISGIIVIVSMMQVRFGDSWHIKYAMFIVSVVMMGMVIQYFTGRAQKRMLEQEQALKASVIEAERLSTELLQANEVLRQQALYDSLTMVPNRNGFYDYAKRYIEQYEAPQLALFIIDVDYFKQYNDCYGHAQGDKVLHAIAQALDEVAKAHDGYVARWGGEEFLVLTTPEHRQMICAAMQQAVETLAIAHERSPISPHITVSIGGFYGQASHVDCLDYFYKSADNALYAVKQSGRNHFQIHDHEQAMTQTLEK